MKSIRIVLLTATLAATPLVVGAADAPPDAWLTTKAKVAVLTAVGTGGTNINVDTVAGRVTLHGTVASDEDKRHAEEAARKIEGVKDVRNLLEVVKADEAKSVTASDQEIEKRVKDALRADRTLGGSDIQVQSVNKGTVLLAGKAQSLSDHLRAIEVARHVPGVRKVASEIQSADAKADREIWKRYSELGEETEKHHKTTGSAVKGTAKDMYITSAAKMRLLADRKTPGFDINVDTQDQVVTLFGTVPSQEAKRKAEADARKVSGVKKVVNELEVVGKGQEKQVSARDAEIEKDIEKAVAGHSDANIEVEVKDGVARLTGTVPSEAERNEAVTIARGTDGVRSVRNEIKVSRSH